MAKWYYEVKNKPYGPIDQKTFFQWIREGSIAPGHLVRSDEMLEWRKASTVDLGADDAQAVRDAQGHRQEAFSLPSSLAFEMTVDDIWAVHEFSLANHSAIYPGLQKMRARARRQGWLVLLLFVGLPMLWAALREEPSKMVELFLVLWASLCAVAGSDKLFKRLSKKKNAMEWASSVATLGRWQFEFGEQGMLVTIEGSRELVRWSKVRAIAEGHEGVYIVTNGVLIIPNRCFENSASVVAAIRAVHNYAPSGTPVTFLPSSLRREPHGVPPSTKPG